MSVTKAQVVTALSSKLPLDILTNLLNEYQEIKRQFVLGRYQPSELNGGRFGECVVRFLEYVDRQSYTPFGTRITNRDAILNRVKQNTNLPDSVRLFIPALVGVLMDVRNKRNVAHVGGDVDPNYSDSLLVCHGADWILVEIVRNYYGCSIDEARQIVTSINEVHIPIVAEVDGFVRVQATNFPAPVKTLVVLYYKKPNSVTDIDLAKWIRYKNLPRYRKEILPKLDSEALIHYENGLCTILPKGIAYVEKYVDLKLLV